MSNEKPASDIKADWCVVVHDGLPVEETDTRDTSNIEEPVLDDRAAAAAFASLIAKKLIRKEDGFFDHEERLMELYVEVSTGSNTFEEHHVQAIRTALKSGYFDLARTSFGLELLQTYWRSSQTLFWLC